MSTVQEQTAVHSTFVLEKHFPVNPEKVFDAFSDPVKRRRWNIDDPGREVESCELDFRVGGHDRIQYRFPLDHPLKGAVILHQVQYQDIVPNRRIVMVYTMAFGEHPFSASQSTFELIPTEQGTDLIFTEQAAFFEGGDGPEMRQKGWRLLLDKLAEVLAS